MHFQVTRENFDRLEALCHGCENNLVLLVKKWGREYVREQHLHDRDECKECDIRLWMEELHYLHEEELCVLSVSLRSADRDLGQRWEIWQRYD